MVIMIILKIIIKIVQDRYFDLLNVKMQTVYFMQNFDLIFLALLSRTVINIIEWRGYTKM